MDTDRSPELHFSQPISFNPERTKQGQNIEMIFDILQENELRSERLPLAVYMLMCLRLRRRMAVGSLLSSVLTRAPNILRQRH